MIPNAAKQPAKPGLTSSGSNGPIGKLPASQLPMTGISTQHVEVPLTTQQVLERFNDVYPTLDSAIQTTVASTPNVTLGDLPADHHVQKLWVQIPAWVRRSTTTDEAGMAVAQKVFRGLFQGDSGLHREVHVAILESLRDSCKRLPKELVSWLAYSDEKRKFHRECIVALLKPKNILNTTEYDGYLAKAIDNGRNAAALEFAVFLIRRCVIEEALATPAELFGTLEVLQKIGSRPNAPSTVGAPEGLIALVEAARKQSSKAASATNNEESVDWGAMDKIAIILENWTG